jgi:hypothetical protein
LQNKPKIVVEEAEAEEKRIQLPFMMACVNATATNEIQFESKPPKFLTMTSYEKIRYYGDGDVLRLMNLG